jgi:uncharacterized protein YecE (DUF72 family)
VDTARLTEFLAMLPRGLRVTFEFRNATWFTDQVYEVLQAAKAGLCLAENDNMETPLVITADFVYLRLRKPDYSQSELEAIDWRIRQYRSNGYPVFAIFKHEESPAGALHAETLLQKQNAGEEPGLVSGLFRS